MTPAAEPASLAGVVLAGGASLRMGRDKATMPVPAALRGSKDGSEPPITMVEQVVGVLRQRCQPIFVVAAPGQSLPELPARVVRDDVRGVGPLLATGRGLSAAAEAGATAVVQPGGSVRDAEVVAAADERNLAMIFTGTRHFRH